MVRLAITQLCMFCLAVGLAVSVAAAHEKASGDVIIRHPWAVPAEKGQNSRVYMVIENEEPDKITLLTLKTPVAHTVELRFLADAKTVLSLSSRSVAAEETLHAGTRHMWFELIDLNQDLIRDEEFPAALFLADGRKIDLSVVVGQNLNPKDGAVVR
jgi:copper(I)-binding protein